jgi:hypothetical protein
MAEGTAETIPNRKAIHIHNRSRLHPPVRHCKDLYEQGIPDIMWRQGAGQPQGCSVLKCLMWRRGFPPAKNV